MHQNENWSRLLGVIFMTVPPTVSGMFYNLNFGPIYTSFGDLSTRVCGMHQNWPKSIFTLKCKILTTGNQKQYYVKTNFFKLAPWPQNLTNWHEIRYERPARPTTSFEIKKLWKMALKKVIFWKTHDLWLLCKSWNALPTTLCLRNCVFMIVRPLDNW